jgi:hypothetical protein
VVADVVMQIAGELGPLRQPDRSRLLGLVDPHQPRRDRGGQAWLAVLSLGLGAPLAVPVSKLLAAAAGLVVLTMIAGLLPARPRRP